MAFRKFPAPKAPVGKLGGKCPSPKCNGTLEDWDCGCSWGCDLCWVAFECNVCGQKVKSPAPSSNYPCPPPVPNVAQVPQARGKPKQKCPHCGAMKVGLADHIKTKHGSPPRPHGGLPAPRHAPPVQVDLECPDCGAPMVLKQSQYGLFYGCSEWSLTGCRGAHGARPDGQPLGIPADSRTRKMRMAAHNAFDELWKGDSKVFEDRSRAYLWMQSVMGLGPDDAHISRFNSDQCKLLIEHIWDSFGD